MTVAEQDRVVNQQDLAVEERGPVNTQQTPETEAKLGTVERSDQIDFVSQSSAMAERIERQISAIDERVQELIELDQAAATEIVSDEVEVAKPDSVNIWGVPFSLITFEQTLSHIDKLIAARKPGYFITANLNYNMLTDQHPGMRELNEEASFILADGMPMVWRSRFTKTPLPERVAGSELIYGLTNFAAQKGHRVYFLGGAPGVGEKAASVLSERYPGLQVAGVYSPPFRELTEEESEEMRARIRDAKTDILYVAFGQPKGEIWMQQNVAKVDVPVAVQLGASFDFVAGCVPRSPKWVQKAGMEWAYRFWREPSRLGPRYLQNIMFLMKAMWREMTGGWK